MTVQEIIEGNRLIAEFMGLKIMMPDNLSEGEKPFYPDGKVTLRANAFTGNGISVNSDGKRVKVSARFNSDINASSLYFDCLWDWLMPVVEKIKSTEKDWPIATDPVLSLLITTPISAVYKAVIDFIQWYNTQSKQS